MKNRPSEFSLISKYFAPLSGEGSFQLRDDAAEIELSPNNNLVVTQDACAESIHFFGNDPANLIAKKALRVNLSDLAAKGAKPNSFSLALGLGKGWDEAWVKSFAEGLADDIARFDIALSGGDTFTTNAGTVISITAIGEVPKGTYVSRMGASIGDQVFVTGTIGDAALGLQCKLGKMAPSNDVREYLEDRYLLPEPRVDFSSVINNFASSAMDVSDGLLGDAKKLADASSVLMEINLEKIPLSDAALTSIQDESKWLETAVTGGDDYEILFTIPKNSIDEFSKTVEDYQTTVTHIGEIKVGQGITVFDSEHKRVEFDRKSYDHSREPN